MEMIYYRGDYDLGDASSNAINTKFKAAKAGAGHESLQSLDREAPNLLQTVYIK